MMDGRMQFIARRQFQRQSIELFVGINKGNGVVAISQPLRFVDRPEGSRSDADIPAIAMTQDEAQSLIDELWVIGLRPSEGTGSAGALAATQRHLEDMRALVFKSPPPKGLAQPR